MKLFFKHLLKSIRRKPAQPIVLILTLSIAIGVCIMSFGLDSCFANESAQYESARYGSSDITVSLNGTSQSRFMFTDEVRELLGDRAEVAGIFELPLLCGADSHLYFGAAVDFFEIEDVFDFSFIQYGEVKKSELSEIAFVSSDFAESEGVRVGDVITAELLGGEKIYTVAAISSSHYLSSYDVMVDIGGAVDVLGADSLFVSALGDYFRPSSTVYIDVNDGYDVDECKELLSQNEKFSDKSILLMADNVESESNIETMQVIVNVTRSFAAILSIAVTFCCLYILAAERSWENQSFRAAGARALHLNLLQYAEVLLYWIFGAVFGCVIGAGLLKFTVYYAGFEYADGTIAFTDAVYGMLLVLAVSILTATVFIASTSRTRKTKKGRVALFLIPFVLIFSVLVHALAFSVPVAKSFVPSLLAMVSVFIISFAFASGALRLLTKGIDLAFEKGFRKKPCLKFPAFRYAVKNVFSVKVLHNFSRLMAMLVAVLLSCFLVIVSADGYILAANELLDADYAVLNSAESCYQKLLDSDAVDTVSKSYFGSANFEHGQYTPAISVKDAEMISDLVGMSKLPTGNEAVFSKGQAKANGLKVGDFAQINVDGLICDVKVAEITDCGLNVIVFDSDYFGIASNMLLVSGKDGVSEDRLMLDISERTALEVSVVVTAEELLNQKLSSIYVYLNTGDVLLTVAVIFAAIGMIDNLMQSYRERREEFELYKSAGMSSASVFRMKMFEILISLTFGIVFGALTFSVASAAIGRGLLAYGYDVFRAIAALM